MGADSKISWTDHTWSPWLGCTKVSPGCDNCYAEAWAKRSGLVEWGGSRRRTSPSAWSKPLRWNKAAAEAGVRRGIFPSLCDPFDNQVPEEWRVDTFTLIDATPWLDWLLLTKRPQNIPKIMPPFSVPVWDEGARDFVDAPAVRPNVWLGTSAENQEEADRRIPHLLAVPAAVHFVSVEPMLGPVDLTRIDVDGHSEMNALRPSSWREVWSGDWSPEVTGLPLEQCISDYVAEGGVYPPTDDRPRGIDWVICGGESGPGARPMDPVWARSLRGQCQETGVPFFFKQWGGPRPGGPAPLDGREWREMPA